MYLIFTDALTDLARELKNLVVNPQLKKHKYVKYALEVESAMSIFNFHKLFVYVKIFFFF